MSANDSQEVNEKLTEIISQIDQTKIEDAANCVSFAGKGLKLDKEEDAKPIADEVEACKELKTINLEGNTLGIDAAKGIGKALETKSTLTNALLKDLFTGRLKTEIPEAINNLSAGIIKSYCRLAVLDLSDNAFGPIGMKSVLPFLQSESCKSLQVLRLNNNGLGIGGGKLLANALVDLKSLKVFICGRNRLENDGSIEIGKSLSTLNSLEQLEMPQNGIRAEGMAVIAKAIESNPGLKILNLNDNNLKGSGGSAIAGALSKLKNIQTVNFGDCLLRRNGCIAVCEALIAGGNIENVKEMILNGNEIGGQLAVEVLDRLFADKQHYKVSLDLSNNNFGSDGVDQLNKLLQNKLELRLLDDEGTDDEEEGEDNEDESNESNKENYEEELAKTIENENDINNLFEQFVSISIQGFDKETLQLRDDASKKSAMILKAALNKEAKEYDAVNMLLVSLGLLKDENGKYKMLTDLRGPLSALKESISYFTPTQKQVLKAFMNRPNKSLEQCGKVKHSLMQALFI